ncbi:MAG: redoxin domain-containing protein [Chloroflexi bacterium]|nr:redoxin domain-containing protein [Chloroflexota bacterium]
MRKEIATVVLGLTMILAACGPTPTPAAMMQAAMPTPDAMMAKPTPDAMMAKPTPDAMMAKPTPDAMMARPTPDAMMAHPTPDAMMAHPTPDAMMAHSTPDAMMQAPAWFGASLTDVRTGQTFSLNGFKGKVVLVETMAQWCPSCRTQQTQVKDLRAMFAGRDDLVTIALDVDPNEQAADLKKYVQANGFEGFYGIAPAAVAREIGNLYGAQFLNPPSTPILIVDRHGLAHPLPFGIKSARDLASAIEPYLKDAM